MDIRDTFMEVFQAYVEKLESKAMTLSAVSDEEVERALQMGATAYMIFHPVALAADRLAAQAKTEKEFRISIRKKA
jgi:diaminopimelate decarboxylase